MRGVILDEQSSVDTLLDSDWLHRLEAFPTLWVGLSGGLDSVVLLHQVALQPALAGKVRAVHIHHGLSPYADAWLRHCQSYCASLNVPLTVRHVVFESQANIEANARHARYEAFKECMMDGDGLLLAHHADDQAETLLLQLFRGAGIDGLGAMPLVKSLGLGTLLRPLLTHSRKTLEAYASRHQLAWVLDESNQDVGFSRNYLRHQIMPLLQEKWPGVVTNLNRTAQHCQQASQNLHALALMDCQDEMKGIYRNSHDFQGSAGPRPSLQHTSRLGLGPTIEVTHLRTLDKARCTNVLRFWLKNNTVRLPTADTFNRLITDVIFSSADALPCVEWDGMVVRRYQNTLYLLKKDVERAVSDLQWLHFPEPLKWGHGFLHATCVNAGLHLPNGSRVELRTRQGGELFHWRGQTKSLKQLFQQWGVPPWQRAEVPLLYLNNKLAAVVGFAVSDQHYCENAAYTYRIELHREPLCPNH
jgi:tRNA(Ile)-lysidine synthase